MVDSTSGSRVRVFAQTMHHAPSGAFTGEVSAPMLSELGAHGVILGHSERREQFGETDRALAQKVPAALDAGLVPILCVGETEAEREQGDTERKLRHQIQEDLAKVPIERLGEVVIAYEPIWAIGTGLVATPEQAQEAIAFIRGADRGSLARAGRADPDPLRRQRQPRERGRAAVAARRRRRAGRRRQPRGRFVRGDRRRRPADGRSRPELDCRCRPACWSCSTAGGSPRPDRATPSRRRRRRCSTRSGMTYPHTQLSASGRAVGLPDGQMGNSEVGHLNLGAGAVVMQDLTRIDEAVEDGALAANDVLRAAFAGGGRVHLIGLVSTAACIRAWSTCAR